LKKKWIMGKIVDLVIETVKKQLKERGIVVWYDPQKVYMNLVRNLSLDDTNILIFENGFFRLSQKTLGSGLTIDIGLYKAWGQPLTLLKKEGAFLKSTHWHCRRGRC